jgi:hypothetical protein
MVKATINLLNKVGYSLGRDLKGGNLVNLENFSSQGPFNIFCAASLSCVHLVCWVRGIHHQIMGRNVVKEVQDLQ